MKTPAAQHADILIIGAGPVGLLLGARLHQLGLPCTLLERRLAPSDHSRAIGIHPPSLELLQQVGVVETFLDRGLKVPGGVAMGDRRVLGRLAFEGLPGPYPFALALPQQVTEQILEKRLHELAPGALRRGITVEELRPGAAPESNEVEVLARDVRGNALRLTCGLLVGCDGKESMARQAAGIPYEGKPYPDAYVMGDFDDNSGFGPDARLFLSARGIVESFPLPGGIRRWVLRVGAHEAQPDLTGFCAEVRRRTGHELSGQANHMLSPFGIQHFLARRFVAGNIVLAGDAAHVVSPIGGQGMNSGWMDARDLARLLERGSSGELSKRAALARYDASARQRARLVRRRAEFNTFMGRDTQVPTFRSTLVWAMLRSGLARDLLARMFTMQGL